MSGSSSRVRQPKRGRLQPRGRHARRRTAPRQQQAANTGITPPTINKWREMATGSQHGTPFCSRREQNAQQRNQICSDLVNFRDLEICSDLVIIRDLVIFRDSDYFWEFDIILPRFIIRCVLKCFILKCRNICGLCFCVVFEGSVVNAFSIAP